MEKGIVLTKADLLNNDKINEINELSYDGFEYISLWVYNSEDGISISKKSNSIPQDEVIDSEKSNENSSNEILLNGFDSSEKMQNTRFKIRAEGLEKIYNEGPKINGLNSTLYVYKNTDIKREYALKGISVSSNIDTTISNENIVITNVDNENLGDLNEEISTIGSFILKYTVTDSWGRTATYRRTVSVISRSVSNDIEFYNENGSKNLFSLKYNPISNIFDVSKKENNSVNNGAGNNPPSEEQPPQDQSPDESEQSSQGTDGELKSKTGNLSEGNNDTVQDNIPNEGNPDQDDNPSVENPPQGDSNNSQGGEGSEGSNDREDNTEQPKKEIVFKLAIFNGEEKKVGEIELTEEETINIEEFKKKLSNITIYDGYYVSVWSNKPERIKIKGYMTGNNELGESENVRIDYSNGTTDKDYIDNVRFNLTEDGIHVIYNKAPKIRFLSNDILTVYAGDPINYTENIQVVDDRDNPENNHIIDNNKIKVSFIDSNEDDGSTVQRDNLENNEQDNGRLSNGNVEEKTEEEKFIEEEKKHLRIGNNTVRLTVQDSWGRESSVERSLIIKNGVDKNTIIFNGENGEIIKIGFNHENNKLNVITYNKSFGNGGVSGYVKIAVYRPNENGVGATAIVPQISIDVSQRVTDSTLQTLKDYTFKYGDYFEIYHGHPNRFSIIGNVTDERENYTDGVQNPENLLNVKFEITKSGLKSIYTNPDENNITNNKVVFGPVAPEKFPFKIQIDFEQKMFKVVDATKTMVLSDRNEVVYKMVLIGSDGHIKKRTEFNGREEGSIYMSTTNSNNGENDRNWNNVPFEYNDCLYLWHIEPSRSIIKGKIKNAREDYSDGVNDVDNMNNVVFRLTPNGLESIYNNAPEINGANNIDVYQNENFNVSEGVTYNDDYDANHLTKSVSLKANGMIRTVANTNNNNNGVNWNLDTSELGEKILIYTATDRWGKTTTVERKVTVRPNLYKNVFKIFAESENTSLSTKIINEIEDNNLQTSESETPSTDSSGSGNTSTGESESETITPGGNTENDTRTPVFEIGFDSITRKYRVFNQSNEKLSKTKLDDEAFRIEIKGSDGEIKTKITLTGNDRGTSPKLSAINDIDYADGDSIRVYRSDLKGIKITGTVTGHIPRTEDNMNETNKFDYMNNTRFIVSDAGLEAKYNKAPVMEGVKKVRTISKGTIDLLEGINISDEEENISTDYMFIYVDDKFIGTVDNTRNSNENSHKYYNFNKVGTYKVKYVLYDNSYYK